MELYRQYIKERSQCDLLVDEQNRGFVAFKCYEDRGEIFIVDLYTSKEARGGDVYPLLMSELVSKFPWATHLTGTIFLDSQDTASATLLSALKSGWVVVGANNNTIAILRKITR